MSYNKVSTYQNDNTTPPPLTTPLEGVALQDYLTQWQLIDFLPVFEHRHVDVHRDEKSSSEESVTEEDVDNTLDWGEWVSWLVCENGIDFCFFDF